MGRRQLGMMLGAWLLAVTAAGAQTPDVAVEYYHLDAVGSVRAVTNEAGAVVRTHDYRPFGEGENPAVGKDAVRFSGKERDAESGLDYFGARYYASRSGRMTTVDPAVDPRKALLDPQQWSPYAYARNNPLRYIDPDGRQIRVMLPDVDYERNAQIRAAAIASVAPLAETNPLYGLASLLVDSMLSNVLPVSKREQVDAANASIFGLMAPLESGAVNMFTRLKPVKFPAWRSVAIDMEEVLSGHTSTGARYLQSGIKDLFPDAMNATAIENAVRNAYRFGQQVGRKQIDSGTGEIRLRIVGPWDRRTIEMWYNETTRTIETAYPK
jgi:RHS repeat-associated protein